VRCEEPDQEARSGEVSQSAPIRKRRTGEKGGARSREVEAHARARFKSVRLPGESKRLMTQ
jgi:hypothetical protein